MLPPPTTTHRHPPRSSSKQAGNAIELERQLLGLIAMAALLPFKFPRYCLLEYMACSVGYFQDIESRKDQYYSVSMAYFASQRLVISSK
jgi:hypothetical protein